MSFGLLQYGIKMRIIICVQSVENNTMVQYVLNGVYIGICPARCFSIVQTAASCQLAAWLSRSFTSRTFKAQYKSVIAGHRGQKTLPMKRARKRQRVWRPALRLVSSWVERLDGWLAS